MLRRIIPIATVVMMLLGLILVGSASAEEPVLVSAQPRIMAQEGACPEKIVIGWAPPDITGVFKTATDFFEKSAEDAGANGIEVEVISQSPATHVAFADQVAILEDYVQRQVDVIAISPIEVEVVKPAIKKANEAGIPVIIVNLLEPIEGVDVASYIGFDNTDAGRISAYSLLDYFGGPGVLGTGEMVDIEPDAYLDLAWWQELYQDVDPETADIAARVAIIEGIAGGFFSTARLNGFHEVVDPFPGIEIVGTLPADWNREKGIKAAEDFLTANPPGTLDAIWAASNEMGLGAMLAAEAAGRLEVAGEGGAGDDYVAVFTNDVTPESADRMREGKLIAETHHGFPEWGWYGTEFAVTLACGGAVPPIFDIRPRTMYQANADLFYPEPALETIDWEAIKAGGAPRLTVPDKIVLGWTPPDITGVFKTATDFFEKSAEDAGANGINVEVVSQSPATHVAFADQVAIIEDYVQRQVNVIAISPIEVEVVKPAIKKANEAGIPVIIVNLLEPIEGVDVSSYIGFDNTDAGRISAYSLLDYFGGPGVLGTGEMVDIEPDAYLDLAWWRDLYQDVDPETADIAAKVAIIEGIAGGFFSTARLNGFHEVVDPFPGIEIVGTLPADWNREKGIKAAEDFLTANPPGALDAIWAASNEMGLGAMLACEAAGRLEVAGEGGAGDDYVAVFTNDVTPESADRMREGKLIAETHHGFPEWGWYGTEFAVTLAAGGKVPYIFDIRPRTMYQANADLFYPEPALEPIDWGSIKFGGSPRLK